MISWRRLLASSANPPAAAEVEQRDECVVEKWILNRVAESEGLVASAARVRWKIVSVRRYPATQELT
ncbi:MAG: hypothetical protein RL077_4848 [Verrucomicrobiota bacterium]|jgi:hypothetical protein